MPACAEMVSATISSHPHQAQRKAHADQDRRQRRRQDHVAVQLPAGQAVAARHLDQALVGRADAVEGIEVDREEHADREQEQLGRLVDAEPQDHQRDQRQRRDVADHLQGGVEQGLGAARRLPVKQAEHQAQPGADGEAGAGAPQAGAQVRPQFARHGQRPEGLDDRPRLGQDAGRQPAGLRRDLPAERSAGRQRPRRQQGFQALPACLRARQGSGRHLRPPSSARCRWPSSRRRAR